MIKILLFVLIPLVFFGAGVLFASLVWGKYKQLAITLRQRNDALAKRESELDEAHAQAKARLIDVETTCHTLEEELALIAQERDDMGASLECLQGEVAAQQAAQRQMEDTKAALAAAQEAHSAQTLELEAAQAGLRAAENKSIALEKEKNRYLDLINKLQAGITHVDGIKRQLRDQERQLTRFRKLAKRLPSKRRHRPASEPRRAMRRFRVSPSKSRPTTAKPAVEKTASSQRPTPSSSGVHQPTVGTPAKGTTINGHTGATPNMAKRMLSRILGASAGSRGKVSKPSKPSGPSRRHW